MTQSLQELEQDIEQSRAQLDQTIDRLQDKMTVSGVVDDMLGTARTSQYGPVFDNMLETIRRNPVPVMLITAGIGLLAYRLSRSAAAAQRRTRLIAADDGFLTEEELIVETGDVRLYDTGSAPAQTSDPMFERHTAQSRI